MASAPSGIVLEALVIYLYELRVLYIDDDKWTELDGLRDDFYKAYTEYFSGIWRLGDMYNILPFKDKAFEGFEVLYLIPPDLDFVEGMVDVALRLENFPADLWNVMTGSMADVLKHGQSYDLDETNALWKKHPAFASDVLQVMVKRSRYSWMK